jgi:hypothetical protein
MPKLIFLRDTFIDGMEKSECRLRFPYLVMLDHSGPIMKLFHSI